jgi:sterol desaturase/sphingolipid hydroxylase (fatty acid hydroxylase superfamily)
MHMLLPRRLHLAFPLLLAGPPLGTLALTGAGLSPAVAMTAMVLLLIALVVALERWAPFRAEWRSGAPSETRTDLVYIAFASVPDRLTRIAVEAAMVAGLGVVVAAEQTWTARSIALAILAFLLSDLGKYLIHRASHEHPWLFRFHLAHHQPARLSAWNALRLHPVNVAYNAAIDAVPLFLLGVGPTAAAVLATIRATVGVIQHANLDLEAGRQWLVNAPSYHRTHHDVRVDEASHNYASTLLVWDRLLGTLHRAPAPARVGVASMHRLPEGFLGQLVHPWCGERLDTTCALARFRWITR